MSEIIFGAVFVVLIGVFCLVSAHSKFKAQQRIDAIIERSKK